MNSSSILNCYRHVWAIDFEFQQLEGERPIAICLVAYDLISGTKHRFWQDELWNLHTPPFDIGEGSVILAYYASAEGNCFLSLRWRTPVNVIDLFAEFRVLTNERKLPLGAGLLGALAYYGLPFMDAAEKNDMRELAIRGGPWTEKEKNALLDYCESDVIAIKCLFEKMGHLINVDHALIRGRYMMASAIIEFNGIPIDRPLYDRLRENWQYITERVIADANAKYGLYDGITFKRDRFEALLTNLSICWPRLESGALCLDDDKFKDMEGIHPAIREIREVRNVVAKLNKINLPIGGDDRNRSMLSAFRSKTGRNQPASSKFPFGYPAWLRTLIRPEEGRSLIYLDWEQQEFGIAAALSQDPAMIEAYNTGDPYMAFAIQAGAAPQGATKQTHPQIREQYKKCVIAVQYSMGEDTFAHRINKHPLEARHLLEMHKRVYRQYWKWLGAVVDRALLSGQIEATFGWRLDTRAQKLRTIQNFPMQANGAEMLRLACIFLVENRVTVCAPVHDAVLIECPTENLQATLAVSREQMSRASRIVLGSFPLRTEYSVFSYPESFSDKRGVEMWGKIKSILDSK